MSRRLLIILVSLLVPLAGLGCSAGVDDPDSEELIGADENVDSRDDAITGSVAVGTTLVTTANLNLRSGPSTNYKILHVIPNGAKVTVVQSAPSNSFYKIKHNGVTGWGHGSYLKKPSTTTTTTSSSARDKALSRAKAGVGFSYWWGHGRFLSSGATSSNKGSCSGSCPSCSHKGSYGGDCSGYAAKVWQVPSSNTNLATDSHPYSTVNFNQASSQWDIIARANVKPADAMVYNTNGAGHIFIYSKGDGWGSMYAYECKGCSAGCIAGYRTASNTYKAIRRKGW